MRGLTKENSINGAPLETVGSLATELTSPLSIQLDIKTPGKTTLSPHPTVILIHLDQLRVPFHPSFTLIHLV
jgi:hypothetical protein